MWRALPIGWRTDPRRTPFCREFLRNRGLPTYGNTSPGSSNTSNNGSRRSLVGNAQHSTGPRTEAGKRRSSLNALRHGLTPATPTESQLVQELVDTSWRLNRIPFLESELLSLKPNPQTLIPQLATLGLHSSRLSRQFHKTLEQLRDIQQERRLENRQLRDAAEILIRHQRQGIPFEPADAFSEQPGFVSSKEQVERHARFLILQNPAYYDPPADGL